MSTATPQPAAPAPPPAPAPRRELVIVSHSGLFYWWPVWAVGYVMFAITMYMGWQSGDRMVSIAGDSKKFIAEDKAKQVLVTTNKDKLETFDNCDAIVAPTGKTLKANELYISSSKNLGVIFCMTLLVVIFITNIPLRGLWSVIVIVLGVSLVIILALLPGDVLGTILHYIFILDIRINAAGYFMISSVLLGLWLFIFLLFDRQIYMIFTPGQMRVKLAIGDSEVAYDTTGITIQKQRSDLFRHWILGLGSGDLIVHVSRAIGEHGRDIPMPNVLFLGRRVHDIEQMLASKQVVVN